jgi:plastocyanin
MSRRTHAAMIVFALAGILASSCGGGGGSSMSTAAPTATGGNTSDSTTTNMVGILGDRGAQSFAPNPVTAKVGQKVAWRNQDGTVHRIVQDSVANNNDDGYGPGYSAGDGVFDAGETAPGATSTAMTLSSAGTVRYHCAIHPSMVGSIVVQ